MKGDLVHSFLLSFIPLFVAIDVIGVVPIYLSFTDRMSEEQKKRLTAAATLTALGISILFLASGKMMFAFLGITENDFRIGGGILLLVLSVRDLLFTRPEERMLADTDVGIVPLGIPLIVGPAALTTILISVDNQGYWITLASLIVNLAIVWVVFRCSKYVIQVMGRPGTKAFARVMAIFLAAIAVMMIRVGLRNTFSK